MLQLSRKHFFLLGAFFALASTGYPEKTPSEKAPATPHASAEQHVSSQKTEEHAPKFNPEKYTLEPNDLIRIQLLYESLVNVVTPVGHDGTISVPFAGTINASGKTILELEKILKQIYIDRLRLRDPKVSVSIEQFRKIRASIVGAVARPGTFEFFPHDTLLTLVSSGGGALPDGRSDMKHSILRRRDSTDAITIDLHALLNNTNAPQNYFLKDGDELYVPEGIKNNVMVIGSLSSQGSFPYTENMRVMTAISLAGGKIENVSMLSKTIVIREKEGTSGEYDHIPVNMIAFLKKGDSSQNIPLKPGDIVYVPQSNSFFSPATSNFLGSISNLLYMILNFKSVVP